MLNDPLSVTVAGIAQSLARGSGRKIGATAQLQHTSYRTSDGVYEVQTTHTRLANGNRRAEIQLLRIHQDSTPESGSLDSLSNGVSLMFESNKFGHLTAADIPELRAALNTLVNDAFALRLINGEG